MAWDCSVYKFAKAGPDDVSGLESLLASGAFKAQEIICIIAKTVARRRIREGCKNGLCQVCNRAVSDFITLGKGALVLRCRLAVHDHSGAEEPVKYGRLTAPNTHFGSNIQSEATLTHRRHRLRPPSAASATA
jgi:hypothetical protein